MKENSINKINKNTIREKFLPEVIDEVDDSKNEISMMHSNNKLNTSNNNIALQPIIEKPANELKVNSEMDIKNVAENKISTSKQKKFITMDSFISKEGLKRVQSKEKAYILKKNLKNPNDENAKSLNLLTFFKSMDIKKEDDEIKNSKNNLHESKENNKNLNDNSIGNMSENIFKSISDHTKNNRSVNREKSLSTDKALINKFLLGN